MKAINDSPSNNNTTCRLFTIFYQVRRTFAFISQKYHVVSITGHQYLTRTLHKRCIKLHTLAGVCCMAAIKALEQPRIVISCSSSIKTTRSTKTATVTKHLNETSWQPR